jgi:chaperonin GroEL
VEEGILPGGGVALVRAAAAVKATGLSQDEEAGFNIVIRACNAPLYWISANAGEDGGVIVNKVKEGTGNLGFDARAGKFVDMVQAGIIDPTKVTRTALTNATSVATLLLTSDALVSDLPKKEEKGHGGGGGMEDMY